jgi:hypothetical protein
MKRKYNYFYKIINKINGNFYYGVHKTDNLNDNYLGGGVRLRYAKKKYGEENFEKEILEFFDTYEEALDLESEIVNEQLVLDPSCYNLTLGGGYGFNEWFVKKGYHSKGRISANRVLHKRIQTDKEFRKYFLKRLSEGIRKKYSEGWRPWKGKKHSEETKEKMRLTHRKKGNHIGEKNSQFGTCWITNETKNKKIHKGDLIPNGWKLGRKMGL